MAKKKEEGVVELPGLELVKTQADQLHRDLGVLVSAGLAGTDASDWLVSAYSGLLARARKVIDPNLFLHLGDADEIRTLHGIYVAAGQIASVAGVFLDEAASQDQTPMGFRPRTEQT